MDTTKRAVSNEFEIAYAVEFLHSVGVTCQPKDLREFYANYPELPQRGILWHSHLNFVRLQGGFIKFYEKTPRQGGTNVRFLQSVERNTLEESQVSRFFACWAFTQYKQKMKNEKSTEPVEVETEELTETEAAHETLEDRIEEGVVILWTKFGLETTAHALHPYYEAETEIPDGGVLVREVGSILYMSNGELVQEISVTDPEPLTVGTTNDSPRASVLGGNVKRRTAPISQMPKEQLDGMFALWAWNEHLKSNADEHKS